LLDLTEEYREAVLKSACTGHLVTSEAELSRRSKRDYEPAAELLQRILQERREKWEADQRVKLKTNGKQTSDNKWRARYKEPVAPASKQFPSLPPGWTVASIDQCGMV